MKRPFIFVVSSLFLFSCSIRQDVDEVQIIATNTEIFGKVHTDPFGSLHQLDEDEKSAYIQRISEQENRITNEFFENETILPTVFEEIKAKSSGSSTSFERDYGQYTISHEYPEDSKFKVHTIRFKESDKVFIFDENERAKGKDFFRLVSLIISPKMKYLAWSEDTVGSGSAKTYILNLETDEVMTTINDTSGPLFWGLTDNELYSLGMNDELKAVDVNLYDIANDVTTTIYSENDKESYITLNKSLSGEIIFVRSDTWLKNSVMAIHLKRSPVELSNIIDKEQNIIFTIDHNNDLFYVVHNGGNHKYSIATFSANSPEMKTWRTIYSNETAAEIVNTILFPKFIAINKMIEGANQLYTLDLESGDVSEIDLADNIYSVSFDKRHGRRYQNYKSNKLYFGYESYLTPSRVYEYDFVTSSLTNQTKTEMNFDSSKYVAKMEYAKSHDGQDIPVTIVALKSTLKSSSPAPAYIYSYGAYGDGMGPRFPKYFFSLIDRGFIHVVAHVRGGNEKGVSWHDGGRLMNKANTGKDLISVTKHLVNQKYTTPGAISVSGTSAAGIPVGYAINNHPELYRSASILVPFVDVLNSLMDDTLAINVTDWTELGNPLESEKVFDYIKSYSPYENIVRQQYPNVFVTGSLDDISVGYWEPLKYIWLLRKKDTGDARLLLNVNTGGHLQSGLYANEYEFAKMIAFTLKSHGIK